MFSVVYGSQTEQQYSSSGRTRDWYALSLTDFELIWRLRLMNERYLFALDVICWIWLMAFHPDKCNILRVTTKKSPQHFYYNMHGHILESVQSAKYMRVTLSADLKWNNHIGCVWWMKDIYLLWMSFVECDCSILNLLIVWLPDNLLIVLILRCAHACCSKNVVAIFWLLLLRQPSN
jgi:hypothetical protein